jgi:undecaprenol kinase
MKGRPFFARLGFSISGLKTTWREEPSFRFQTLAAVAVIVLLAVTKSPPIWWALLLLPTGAVLTAELFNTALERLADRLHPETHPVIAAAKDCASAAVLVSSASAALVFAAFLWDLARRL